MTFVEENVMREVQKEGQIVVVDVVDGEEEVEDHSNREDHHHQDESEEDLQFVARENINPAEEMAEIDL